MLSSNYYIWLQKVLGAGAVTEKIFSTFSSPEEIFMSSERSLRVSGVFSGKQIEKIRSTEVNDSYAVLSDCAKLGVDVITPDMELYPEYLLEIPNFPLVLYTKGDMTCLKNKIPISIVGARRANPSSKGAAMKLSGALSSVGFTVVSGGALGIDSSAHTGAITVGGKTACILGCGIGSDYLSENKYLRDAISKNGVLISEHPPQSPPARGSFPVRNRIIAGISVGTVVIEAGIKSGSLITAKYANEMGRDVFAVPSSLFGSVCGGTDELIRDGACQVNVPMDIVKEYLQRFADRLILDNGTDLEEDISYTSYDTDAETITNRIKKDFDEPVKRAKKKELPFGTSRQARLVYESFEDKEKTVNEVVAKLNLPTSEILGALTELELLGFITLLPNTKYKLI